MSGNTIEKLLDELVSMLHLAEDATSADVLEEVSQLIIENASLRERIEVITARRNRTYRKIQRSKR
jgi:hypothetical protein